MPDIGDQVSVIMDEHNENGYVSGSLPSNVDITPVGVTLNKTFFIQTKDGTTFQYDRSTSSYSVAFTDAAGSISITMQTGASFTLASDGTLTLQDAHGTQLELDNAGNCYCSGNLRVKGTITEGFGTGATVGVSTHQHGTGSAAAGTVAPTPNT
jgi:phage baseplate assembly protein gpV